MEEEFILSGKKRKEYEGKKSLREKFSDYLANKKAVAESNRRIESARLRQEALDSKKYLAQVREDDINKRLISKAKKEKFERSGFGKVVNALGNIKIDSGVSMAKKKKKKSKKRESYFGSDDFLRF